MIDLPALMSLVALIFSVLGFCFAVYNFVRLEGFANSTHKIEYRNMLDEEFYEATAEKPQVKPEESWSNIDQF